MEALGALIRSQRKLARLSLRRLALMAVYDSMLGTHNGRDH